MEDPGPVLWSGWPHELLKNASVARNRRSRDPRQAHPPKRQDRDLPAPLLVLSTYPTKSTVRGVPMNGDGATVLVWHIRGMGCSILRVQRAYDRPRTHRCGGGSLIYRELHACCAVARLTREVVRKATVVVRARPAFDILQQPETAASRWSGRFPDRQPSHTATAYLPARRMSHA